MPGYAKTEEITNFLIKAKDLIENKCWFFSQRKKNLDSLAKHGLTIYNAKDELYKLTYRNYVDGPLVDIDQRFPGEVWVFGKSIDKVNFYIKLKITGEPDGLLVCLSFHGSNKPMVYPYE